MAVATLRDGPRLRRWRQRRRASRVSSMRRVLPALLVLGLVLSACSSTSTSGPTSTKVPVTTKPSTTTSTGPATSTTVARPLAHPFAGVNAPAVVQTSMWSASLERYVAVAVYLPPGFTRTGRRYPVLYLLHGVPGSARGMVKSLDLKRTLDRLIDDHRIGPMIVVAPSDGPLAKTDTEWENSPIIPKWKWGSLVTRDLVTWSENELPVCTTRSGRALGGLSMGAFGAINLALHNLAEYGSVTLWSPYFIGNTPRVEGRTGSRGWFDNSPLKYLPLIVQSLRRYRLHMSFYSSPGVPGFRSSVEFAAVLKRHHIPYRFTRGLHSWRTWRDKFPSEMIWLSRYFHC